MKGRCMLKKLTIKNFKAIRDMTIDFTPLTVLIGANSCGKSTVLQALDFLRSAATRDISEYLREKGWSSEEIKSNTEDDKNRPIEFIAVFMFLNSEVKWHFIADCDGDKWSTRELISVNGKGVVAYRTKPGIFDGLTTKDAPEPFKNIKLESSSLKIIDDYLQTMSFGNNEISALKIFLQGTICFGLLSPEKMRSGNDKNSYNDIGPGGESLAAYIHGMSETHRKELEKAVSGIIGSEVTIFVKNIDGKFVVHILEKFENDIAETTASHMSDGLLRIIAFSAIMQKTKTIELAAPETLSGWDVLSGKAVPAEEDLRNGIILLDEIENGINPYVTEKVVGLFRKVVVETNRQVIVTTHSPALLNDFEPEEVVFLWKDKSGSAHCKQMFSTEGMQEPLGFLNPGEIWENFGKDVILTKLNIPREDT
jgi:predicted ATPase